MSLSTLKFAAIEKNGTVVIGQTQIPVNGKAEDVIAVTTYGEDDQLSDSGARFYLSPLVAKTAFEDISKGVAVGPAFAGRTYDEMQAHLLKNQK